MPYGILYYGAGVYGISSLPVSDTWDIIDLCEPTDATMITIMSHPETYSARTFVAPQYSFSGSSDLCLLSDDALDSGIGINISIPSTFSTQFTILPTAIPPDFSNLVSERLYYAVRNQIGKMVGLLLSENGGLALAQDGLGTGYQHLIDSADLFTAGAQYYTFRVTVNGVTGAMNIYVTPTVLLPVIGHQLKITTQAQDTPAGAPDGLVVEVYGSPTNLTSVCFDCIRLSSKEVVPNARPVADPGVSQTSTLYKYAHFDGRDSYDPEGKPLRYWWTITGAPESSEMWLSGTAETPADASGYSNIVSGSAGEFDGVNVGDLLFIEDQQSVVEYVHSDSSYVVAIDHVFTAGSSNVLWSLIKQSAWEGSWVESKIIYVEDYTDTEPPSPGVGAKYLIGTNPVGNPNWVVGDAGKVALWDGLSWTITAQAIGSIVYSIAAKASYRLLEDSPYNWLEDDPEFWELPHWTGRTYEIGTMLPDVQGLFTVELVVNDGTSMINPPTVVSIDGSLNSLPAETLLNVSPTGAPLGIVPDLSFIWNYLSNFWTLVSGKEMIETAWGGAAQVLAGDLLELWQNDYAKSIFDVQRLFQRRWRGYDFFIEEPQYDEELYQAVIDTSLDTQGYSAFPGVGDYAYEMGTTPPAVQSGHMLILNGQCYEIWRAADTSLIMKDILPESQGALVYFTGASGTFIVGEAITGSVTSYTGVISAIEWNHLVIDSPTGEFQNGETITGSTSGKTATVSGFTSASVQRPQYWQIRPFITSKSTDFTLEAVQLGDTAIFDIEDSDENDHIRVGCFVYGARGYKLCFDDTSLATYLTDTDRYTTRFFGVLRRNYIAVDAKIRDLSSLQEIIDVDNVEDAPAILVGNNDFIVETITAVDSRSVQVINLLESYLERKAYGFDGDTDSTPSGQYFDSPGADFTSSLGPAGTDLTNYLLWVGGERYRLLEVTSATRLKLVDEALTTGNTGLHWRVHECGDPPDRSWAETTYVDNNDTIESNFGSRVGFTQDDWVQRTEDLDYLSAVQGLWYAFWNGPTLNNIQTACQVLMGLPFAEKAGTVIDVRTPFNTEYNRVLIQDEGDEVVVRSYKFPVTLDVATNPSTGVAYTIGDTIAQFAPVCTGVLVEDYISNPEWLDALVDSGDLHEVQKFHTFGVTVDSTAFNYTNIIYMIGYLIRLTQESVPKIRPHYTYPTVIVLLELEELIDVEDAILFGPAWPPSPYTYPDNSSWRRSLETPVPAGWSDSPALPEASRWSAVPTYDPTTRWPADRVSDVPPRPIVFGGLHVSDVPGDVQDPWTGSWPQGSPGTHQSTLGEGTFQYGDTDESGHFIHVYGPTSTSIISDGDMENGFDPGHVSSPWDLANYGGSSHALSAVKDATYTHDGSSWALKIDSIGPSLGVEQDAACIVGRQLAAVFWVYIQSGQVHLEMYDGATQVAEWRLNFPIGQWKKVVLYHPKATNSTVWIRILTGPSGAVFWVDDVAVYSDNVPWAQWGYGRMYAGRTGGYTDGGLPDEDMVMTMYTEIP